MSSLEKFRAMGSEGAVGGEDDEFNASATDWARDVVCGGCRAWTCSLASQASLAQPASMT